MTNKQEITNSVFLIKKTRKMPIFKCSCRASILIIPDLTEMNKAIKTHLIEHKRITGHRLQEEVIIEAILKTITENS